MNLTIASINEVFAICKTSILNEMSQAEQIRAETQRLENINLAEKRKREIRIRNEINKSFADLKEMVKSVFAEPSELSQFLLEKVLNKSGQYHFLTRQVFIEEGPAKPCPELDSVMATSMKPEEVIIQLIDLVEIGSLSSERNRFFLALGIPSLGFQVDAKTICQAEPIAYRYVQAEGGALFVEECHISTSFSLPANVELRDELERLCDFMIFCDTLLKRHQNLITS